MIREKLGEELDKLYARGLGGYPPAELIRQQLLVLSRQQDYEKLISDINKVISDRGVTEKDCTLPLPERIDNLIVEQRSSQYWKGMYDLVVEALTKHSQRTMYGHLLEAIEKHRQSDQEVYKAAGLE